MNLDPLEPFPTNPVASLRPAGFLQRLRRLPLLIGLVLVPGLIGTLYLSVIASPMYVSEAQFVVRSAGRPQMTALSSVFLGTGLSGGETDAFAAHEFMMSRDELIDLAKFHDLRARLARPEADLFSKFPRPLEPETLEGLHKAFPRFVELGYKTATGISTLKVTAFRAADAQALADALLDAGEAQVNRLNERSERDAIRISQQELAEAEVRVAKAQADLAVFRNQERLIDPARTSAASLDLVGRLALELASLRAERSALVSSAPQSPQITPLDNRIAAYEQQIAAERLRIVGGNDSLAPKIGTYERLILAREFADKALAASTLSFETAKQEARRKRMYLERVVEPGLPDEPLKPERGLEVLKLWAGLLLTYGIIALVLAAFREQNHQ